MTWRDVQRWWDMHRVRRWVLRDIRSGRVAEEDPKALERWLRGDWNEDTCLSIPLQYLVTPREVYLAALRGKLVGQKAQPERTWLVEREQAWHAAIKARVVARGARPQR